MGFWKRLFGKKKKEEPQKQPEAPQEKEMQEVSLEDVEKELEELEEKQPEPVKEEKETESKDVYHIKKHPEGWQVIKEGAEKAFRVFPYQKDAIEFADKEGLEYQVYRTDGTLRK